MRIIIYGRVSTLSQDVDRQIEELVSYCKGKDYEVVRVFTETISGVKTRKQRKEINQLLEYVSKNNNINGVLVWELSRLGRNTLDVLEIINQLTLMKIWVYSKKENLYTLNQDGTENPTTKLTLTILSGVSTLERETILSRSVSGLKKSVNDGNWLGGKYLPYGYKRDKKKLVIDEEESDVVKLIFQLYLDGNGTKKISNELNKRKIPTRYNKSVTTSININNTERKGDEFVWRDGTIYSILTNPLYIGKKIGKGQIEGLKLQSPVLINENDFNDVQQKLKNTIKKHSTKFFYLFDKKIKCGLCGRNYHPHKRTNNKDNRYICLSRRYSETCGNYGISIPKLQDGVWSLLRNNENEIKKILELNNNDSLENEIHQLEEQKNTLSEKIGKIERQEKNLVDLLLDEKIDKNIYNKKYLSINQDKESLKKELSDCLNELNIKIIYKKKQSNVSLQLKGIKENKRILKRTIDNILWKINVYPILNHNLNKYVKINKQDKFVYLEVYTYMNDKEPLCFIVSQRTDLIITPNPKEFDKENFSVEIGKPITNGGEEEESEVNIRKLFHLRSLD
ncbi:MAG: recombinase family protein [Sediminibacterium sp.]|jgi:DNA invertase Pin-like site-specific DNA recombinase|nr:recombinase family protein [Sediminibacterium sp.]